MKRKKLLLAAAVLTIAFPRLWAIDISTPAQAANEAGRQRMLTQRILKDYAMIGMRNTFGKPEEDLKQTVSMFDDHLNALTAFASDPSTKKSLAEQKALWEPLKKILEKPPTKEQAVILQERLDALLQSADKTTRLFAKQTGKVSGEIINISGRQRMLSQRMAGLYMLKVWGIDDPKFHEKLAQAMELFETSLNRLMASDLNTPEIDRLLNRVKKSFLYLKVMNRSRSKFVPTLIYKKSNEILKDMNTVTGLYASQNTGK